MSLSNPFENISVGPSHANRLLAFGVKEKKKPHSFLVVKAEQVAGVWRQARDSVEPFQADFPTRKIPSISWNGGQALVNAVMRIGDSSISRVKHLVSIDQRTMGMR